MAYNKRLTELSPNHLHNKLLKRKLSPARIQEIKDWVAKRKKQINDERVAKIRKERWAELIKPLSTHIASVQTHQPYHAENNEELHVFYEGYLGLLETTRKTLTEYKATSNMTPRQHIYNERRIQATPNWTDYIDEETKEDITQRYDSIPYPSKYSHRRELFPRPKQIARGGTK